MGRQEKREWLRKMDKLKYKGQQCPLCHKNTEFIVGQDNHNFSVNGYCLRCGMIVADDVKRPVGTKMSLVGVQAYRDDAELEKAKVFADALVNAKDSLSQTDTMILANNIVSADDGRLLHPAGGAVIPIDQLQKMLSSDELKDLMNGEKVGMSMVGLDEAAKMPQEAVELVAKGRPVVAACTPAGSTGTFDMSKQTLEDSMNAIKEEVGTTFEKAGFNQEDTAKLAEVAVNSVGTGVFINAQDAAAAVIKAVNSPTKFNLSGLKR